MRKALFVLLAIALCMSLTVSATTTAKACNKIALQGCYHDCNDCFGIPALKDACHLGCYIACVSSSAA